jgi:hypothetical protein
MATTNLISKSLGDVLTESGNGTPDHTSPLGSLYTDKDTGKLWRNTDGATSWEVLTTVAYGEAYFQDNANTTTITGSTWTDGNYVFTASTFVVGFSADTTTLTLLNGYDGDYEIKGNITLSEVAGSADYEVGLSINGAEPSAGSYGGTYLDATTYSIQHVGFQTTKSLTGGTTLSLDVRNLTNTNNVDILHGQLFARRVG